MDQPTECRPYLLEPVFKPKVWGGTALRRLFGYPLPAGECIGEAWLANESSPLLGPAGQGKTVGGWVDAQPAQILGRAAPASGPARFPLLAKFLDAEDELSVQVHPPDEYARAREGVPFGKAEAWYVVEAAPGACVYHGTTRHLTPDELITSLGAGRVAEVLAEVAVQPGDVILNPPGTIHALGGGIVLYEIQQDSDLTYRLYDWDRHGSGSAKRELQLQKGLEVANLQPIARHKVQPLTIRGVGFARTFLCASVAFCLELLEIDPGASVRERISAFQLLTSLHGECVLTVHERQDRQRFSAGETMLVPACAQSFQVEALSERLALLRAYVPHLVDDVVRPLQLHGIAPDQILQLGGNPVWSGLDSALAGRKS